MHGRSYVDERWDDTNKPRGYLIGASPGFSQYDQVDKLASMGLARKIAKASRMGFYFAMIDYEALSEMYEPELEDQVRRIKEAQGDPKTGRKFEIGLHMPTDIDLCIASAFEWKVMHEKLTKSAYSARKIVYARYALFHTSSRIRPHVTFNVGQREYPQASVSHDGINLADFMQNVDQGSYIDPLRGAVGEITSTPDGTPFKGMVDWFKGKFIKVLFSAMGAVGDIGMITFIDDFILEQRGSGYQDAITEATKKCNTLRKNAWSEVKSETIRNDNVRISQAQRFLSSANPANAIEIQKAKDLINTCSERIRILNSTEYVEEITEKPGARDYFPNELYDFQNRVEFRLNEGKNPRGEITKSYKDFQEFEKVVSYDKTYNFDKIFRFWRQHGSECEEQIAYRVIAKYMWLTKDPLWADVVGEQYDPDVIIYCADNGHPNYRRPHDKSDAEKSKCEKEKDGCKNIKTLVENLITAVAAKYIEGHLYTTDEKWSMKREDHKLAKDQCVYDYMKEGKVHIYIETAMPPQGQEGQLRIMSATDSVKVVKNLDSGKFISYCVDFEHLLVNFVDIEKDIKNLPPGDAKYITMVHINAPRPMMGAHAPVDMRSNDQLVLYKWLHLMQDMGMDNAYLIWEMGSYGVQESALAFRYMAQELSKRTNPKDLPLEFFGIDSQFEAQQWVNMKEHAYDPLKGLLMNPEEEHTLLSREALKKNKMAEWKAGRYR